MQRIELKRMICYRDGMKQIFDEKEMNMLAEILTYSLWRVTMNCVAAQGYTSYRRRRHPVAAFYGVTSTVEC